MLIWNAADNLSGRRDRHAEPAGRSGRAAVESHQRRIEAAGDGDVQRIGRAQGQIKSPDEVSNPERAIPACSEVNSRMRTRRAIAEENSATAKSLTISGSETLWRKVSARPLKGSGVSNATRMLVSR